MPFVKKIIDKYVNKKFLIIGFSAKTGLSAAGFFDRFGIKYKISDVRSPDEILPLAGECRNCLEIFCGPQNANQLDGISCVLLSPGVPRSISLVQAAVKNNIPVYTDVDFIFQFLEKKKTFCITGTDGKTTVTSLLSAILACTGKTAAAGNIGTPVFSCFDKIINSDYAVFELSSFMLEDFHFIKPAFSVITNIAEDHMDRYPSMAEYSRAKFNMVRNCPDRAVFIKNLDNKITHSFTPACRCVTISQQNKADYFFYNGSFHIKNEIFSYKECLLKGIHNIENILCSAALAAEAGVPGDIISRTVREFPGVPHRMQYLGDRAGRSIYNDSKATTIHAVEKALASFEKNIILILGGRNKGLDFSQLQKYNGRIKQLVCYGEYGLEICNIMKHPQSVYISSFDEACRRASLLSLPGDTILLSPGCTSWDQFPNYEIRGERFGELMYETLA